MSEPTETMQQYAAAAAEYQLAKKHAEGIAADVATLSAKVWFDELDRRFPDVTFAERDCIIEVGFGTDPAAAVGLIEQLKIKGLEIEHIEKDPFGLRLCCRKIQEGTEPLPRTPIIGV